MRYFAYLNLFAFFMLLLVLAANFATTFVGWEGVGLASYFADRLLVRRPREGRCRKKAFIVNRIGDAGFLVAMFLIFATFETLDFAEVFAGAPNSLAYGGPAVTGITLLLFVGATGKSAQIPLYVWLPDAMAGGPTAVSALIHAATMVTAGVHLVARASVLFAMAPVSMIVVAGTGALTALFAATIAIAQYDIKPVLAYSTVSQLGYMFLAAVVGAYASGIFHLMTQAFFKGLLFLGAGAVIHSLHAALHHAGSEWDAQDMRDMGGLRRRTPVTWLAMWSGTRAIAGVWPFTGFFSKEEILWQAATHAVGPFQPWFTTFWILGLIAAVLTAIYMASQSCRSRVAAVGVILATCYMLPMVQRIWFTQLDTPQNRGLPDLSRREGIVLVPLVAVMIWIGVYPKPILARMEPPVAALIRNLEHRASSATEVPRLSARERADSHESVERSRRCGLIAGGPHLPA